MSYVSYSQQQPSWAEFEALIRRHREYDGLSRINHSNQSAFVPHHHHLHVPPAPPTVPSYFSALQQNYAMQAMLSAMPSYWYGTGYQQPMPIWPAQANFWPTSMPFGVAPPPPPMQPSLFPLAVYQQQQQLQLSTQLAFGYPMAVDQPNNIFQPIQEQVNQFAAINTGHQHSSLVRPQPMVYEPAEWYQRWHSIVNDNRPPLVQGPSEQMVEVVQTDGPSTSDVARLGTNMENLNISEQDQVEVEQPQNNVANVRKRPCMPKIESITCLVCTMEFANIAEMKAHMHKNHAQLFGYCGKRGCESVLPNYARLVKHFEEEHVGSLMQMRCHLCDRKFPSILAHRAHQVHYHHRGRFVCNEPECDFVSEHQYKVQQHCKGCHD